MATDRARRPLRRSRSLARRTLRRGRRALEQRARSGPPPPPPNFLIVGAQKAGTRWLRHNLGRHPEVFNARREVEYFDHHFERGLDWYRRQFEGWSGERAVGESTPGYMIWRNRPHRNAARIDEQLPGARLFAVLRDPCERTYSAFHHHLERRRLSPDDDLLEYVTTHPPEEDRLQLIVGGWYAASLEPFFDRFGDRLLVFLNEDIRDDAAGVYRTALAHLGLDAGFVPDGLERVRFSNPAARDSKYRLPGGGRRGLTDEERAALYPYFAGDIERLEAMLGRDLSSWKH